MVSIGRKGGGEGKKKGERIQIGETNISCGFSQGNASFFQFSNQRLQPQRKKKKGKEGRQRRERPPGTASKGQSGQGSRDRVLGKNGKEKKRRG